MLTTIGRTIKWQFTAGGVIFLFEALICMQIAGIYCVNYFLLLYKYHKYQFRKHMCGLITRDLALFASLILVGLLSGLELIDISCLLSDGEPWWHKIPGTHYLPEIPWLPSADHNSAC